jgi:S1-C subfamily serine protease
MRHFHRKPAAAGQIAARIAGIACAAGAVGPRLRGPPSRDYNRAMGSVASRRRATGWWRLLLLALVAAAPAAWAQRVATGTGFFITADGYFVTCFHVVVGSNAVSLRNLKGETIPARVVQVDRSNDLALLKAEGSFRALPLTTSANVQRGAAIVTMGFPNVSLQGIEPKVTDGIINSFSGANNDPRVFQVSAPVQTGNSGGPLVSMEGNVIGVVASKLDAQAAARQTGDIPQNVNYAIKSQYLLDLIDRVAATEPRLRQGLARPLAGEKARVVDIVPAIEDAIALVLASSGPAAPAAPAEAARAPIAPGPPAAEAPQGGEARRQRLTQVVGEYRKLQQQLNDLNLQELSLINRASLLKLLLRFEQTAPADPRRAELDQLGRKLEDIGTSKAETIRRLNELAVEYRQLQGTTRGST